VTAATETRAAMSSAEINDLPDSAFAHIEPGGTKDSEGKTTPRSLRHFPVHDAAHVRNALARLSSSPFGDKARPKVVAAARKFGVEVGDADGDDRAARVPLELLKRRRGSMIRKQERRGMLLEMRARPDGTGGTTFEFEGYGAVFNAPFQMWDPWGDPYTEVVRQGAFTESLGRPDLDVPFLIGHDDSRLALARTRNGTMQLSQDSHGMLVRAQMDGRRSDVRDLAYAVERGDQDEMSIGFVTEKQAWSDDWMLREMLGLNLHRGDVSSVSLAANPAAAGASMTALPTEILSRQAAEDRARGEVSDNDSHPDFNVATGWTHAPFTGTHSHPHSDYGAGDDHGHEHAHDGDGSHDHHSPPYDGDGMMVLDDAGVVEEVAGAQGDANMLSLRLRLLELA